MPRTSDFLFDSTITQEILALFPSPSNNKWRYFTEDHRQWYELKNAFFVKGYIPWHLLPAEPNPANYTNLEDLTFSNMDVRDFYPLDMYKFINL